MNLDIRFDFQRRERIGIIEAIWGQDKSVDQLIRISEEVLSKKEVVFITRINKEKASHLIDIYKEAKFLTNNNLVKLWKEPFNQKKVVDSKSTALDQKWKLKVEENFLKEEDNEAENT